MVEFLNKAQRAALAVRTWFRSGQARPAPASVADEESTSLQAIRCISHGEGIAGLPEMLQSACESAPLSTTDARFVGRAESLGVVEAAIAQWRAGVPAMLVVTAPQGAGLTSLLARIPALLQPGEQIDSQAFTGRIGCPDEVLATVAAWFKLEPPPTSAHDLTVQLRAAAPRVILVDDGHYLVNRLAGLEPMRMFGSVLVSTQDRHLWVLGCRGHAFARLVYLHQADRFFTHHVELPYFASDELAEILRIRMKPVALQLSAGEAETADATAGLGEGRLRELYQRSGGKPDLAFACLLRASRQIVDTGYWQVARPPAVDVSVLQELERPELLALAELIVHGDLSVAEHGAIFRVPSASSALSLSYLYNMGLLDRFDAEHDESAIRYAVVKPIWALVVKYLETANYLY